MHTTIIHAAGTPASAPEDNIAMRRQICSWCVDTIHRHLCLMNSICKGIITESKLQSATIGLLYLMRNGVVVHELVVLPKLQV